MKYRMGPCELEAGSEYLTLDLRESQDLLDDPSALRERMAEDGYLLLRGLHDRDDVLAARKDILERMAARGQLDPDAPLMEGVAHPHPPTASTISVRGLEELKTESLRSVVYGPRVLAFFERFLGGEPLSFNFQWLRTAGPGIGSDPHCDVVFMGRGTKDLYTCWTPLGDISLDMGPLAICLGSHRFERVLETYGRSDVDRDRIQGHFTSDPSELVERFGGRWGTTSYAAGDAIIVSMFLMHASLTNTSRRFRISCDTRYQRRDEPVDERWSGEEPRMHDAFWDPGTRLEPLEKSRARWGV